MTALKFLSDEMLMGLVKKSNSHAFSTLYDRYWEKLFAISYRLLKDTPECEDIVHEVFLSLWKNRASLDVEHVNAYLASAIRFKTFSYLRKQTKKPKMAKEGYEQYADLVSADTGVEDTIHERYLLEKLEQRLGELPEKCEAVFRYSRFEYLKNEEIADKLHISKRTVENQIGKALRILRPHFNLLNISSLKKK